MVGAKGERVGVAEGEVVVGSRRTNLQAIDHEGGVAKRAYTGGHADSRSRAHNHTTWRRPSTTSAVRGLSFLNSFENGFVYLPCSM